MFAVFALLLALVYISRALDSDVLRETLESSSLDALFPGDPGYAEAAKTFNQRFTYAPIAILFPRTPEEVSISVKAGASQNLRVAARSGGHSYIASSFSGQNGSLLVDLSRMQKFTYDTDTETALIETGLRLGDIALALNEEGRFIPHGRCTYVGIGGHSGFGGFGFISRRNGLTLDNVKSATLVLANGTIAVVSDQVHPDLFWAIRGSSASFGIVTSIQVQTHPVPENVTIFNLVWELNVETTTAMLAKWQIFVDSGITPDLGGELVLSRGDSSGNVKVAWFGAYYGSSNTFNATVKPYLDEFPSAPIPSQSSITSGNWLTGLEALVFGALNTSTAAESRDTFYAKSIMTPEAVPMSQDAMSTFITYLGNEGFKFNGSWFVEVELYGGSNSAINSVPLDATAFAHRNKRFNMQLYASAPNSAPPFPDYGFTFVEGMVSSIVSNMPADWPYGAYVNYLDDRLPNWKELYYGSHYERLHVLKHSLDPQNVYHFPHSIK
ncbi:hypothetical protein C8J56DRAFT_1103208 [Mycena floridula]|nr:hypothetical protein C8J56DRAFT_1103208 [Mycena floridula]